MWLQPLHLGSITLAPVHRRENGMTACTCTDHGIVSLELERNVEFVEEGGYRTLGALNAPSSRSQTGIR